MTETPLPDGRFTKWILLLTLLFALAARVAAGQEAAKPETTAPETAAEDAAGQQAAPEEGTCPQARAGLYHQVQLLLLAFRLST